MKHKWAYGCLKAICLRRQLGREPTEEEEETHPVDEVILGSLREDDVMDAVSRGQEVSEYHHFIENP